MDGASLAFATVTVFKEIYLVSKFVYKKISTVNNHITEKEVLIKNFYWEFLYLRSFHAVLLQSDNRIVIDQGLNEALLQGLLSIVEKLRQVFLDYANLAIEDQDPEYTRYSPYRNNEFYNSSHVEFSFSLDDVQPPALEDGPFSVPSQTTRLRHDLVRKLKRPLQLPIFHAKGWKFALLQEPRLLKLIADFQRQNVKLRDMIPVIIASSTVSRLSAIQSQLAGDSIDVSELSHHMSLRRLADDPSNTSVTPDQTSQLTIDNVSDNDAHAITALIQPQSGSVTPKPALVEVKHFENIVSTSQSRDDGDIEARNLAAFLLESGRYQFQTLPFQKYIKQVEQVDQRLRGAYAYFFDFPQGSCSDSAPRSLHDFVKQQSKDSEKLPLLTMGQRQTVAWSISKALAAFHADGWVHKSVRSESIQFFKFQDRGWDYESPYLVGFEFSRPVEAESLRTYDWDPERNLYRHPDRQGPPRVKFNAMHDIYALGVVLLEIGMWETARGLYDRALHKKKGQGQQLAVTGDKRSTTMVKQDGPQAMQAKESGELTPSGVKKVFIQTAERWLPHTMGEPYAEAVLTCLKGCDGDLPDPSDPRRLATVFMKKVLLRLAPESS